MAIFDVVINDHRRVEAVFNLFKAGLNYDEAKKRYIQLCEELNVHAIAGEGVLYPALIRYPDMADLLKNAL
jgi:hemerythrin superfamily protein